MSKPKFVVHKDPTFPNGKMLMGYQGKSMIDTGVFAPYIDYESVLEPSAVERLGGLADPELQADIDRRDELLKDPFSRFNFEVHDAVVSPSCFGATPSE